MGNNRIRHAWNRRAPSEVERLRAALQAHHEHRMMYDNVHYRQGALCKKTLEALSAPSAAPPPPEHGSIEELLPEGPDYYVPDDTQRAGDEAQVEALAKWIYEKLRYTWDRAVNDDWEHSGEGYKELCREIAIIAAGWHK